MSSHSKTAAVEITQNVRGKSRQRNSSANTESTDLTDLPAIIRADRAINDSLRMFNPHSDWDGADKSKEPKLLEKDLAIEYDRWKKRTCCHQFSNTNLEKHFWTFYMNNHTVTIRVIFTTILIFAVIGWTVVDYAQLENKDIDLFWRLFYLRLLWSMIILVFLFFYQIGISERDKPETDDQQMRDSRRNIVENPMQLELKGTEEGIWSNDNANRGYYRKNSYNLAENEDKLGVVWPLALGQLKSSPQAIREVEQGAIDNSATSWYSRLGALTVKHSFASVFAVCCWISGISITMSYLGNRPSHKPYIMWFILIHIFCGLGNKASSFLCWVTTVMFCIINAILDDPHDDALKNCAYVVCVSIILSVMGEFLEFSYRKLFYKRRELELEQYKNDVMLTNVVPPRIAYQLQRGEREAVSYGYEAPNWGASVLFCQICDFEELTNALSPSALVNYLNKVFTKMDKLSSRNRVYKVETVKEVYMAASGLPQPDDDHMNQIAHFALDIKDYLIDKPKALTIDGYHNLESPTLKIGINCGTVIAGVIGKLCPRYRLFGDTVNVAARMETNSEKGKIQITKEFNTRINLDVFITVDRGLIEIKGKSSMYTYFLTGRREGGASGIEQELDYNTAPESTKTEQASRLSQYHNYTGMSMVEFCHQVGMMAQRSP